jgi:hypothetical protein
MLGPPEMQRGRTGGLTSRCCDRLRCTACDFAVISFPETAWSEQVDYFFIRNKFPVDRVKVDTANLQQGLKQTRGSTSFCCQCAWVTVSKPTDVTKCKEPAPTWRCMGH